MPNSITTSLPIPAPDAPEKNPSKLVQTEAFWDIDPNYRLSNAQSRAIQLALDGLRWSQIADILSLNRKTLWRWKTQDPDFRQALANARADRLGFALERCQTLAQRATSVLGRFLDDPAEKNRMRAAQLLLQAAARFKLPPEIRRPGADYPDPPLVTPPPDDYSEPELEPKIG